MIISPTYAGDGAFSGRSTGGGLEREWAILKDAMSGKQVSDAVANKKRDEELAELSYLLDEKAIGIETGLVSKMSVLSDAMTTMVKALTAIAEQFKAMSDMLSGLETRIVQLEADVSSLSTQFPPDAVSGDSNIRPGGRIYRQVVVNG